MALGRAILDEVIEEERPAASAVPLARLRRLSSRRRDTGGRLMAPPLVSAVTIVRDGERFLEEAIDSVLRQTYRNLELVVVDDGSTYRSAEIAARFARADPDRVRLVRHADGSSRGMSAARTLGVRAAHDTGVFPALVTASLRRGGSGRVAFDLAASARARAQAGGVLDKRDHRFEPDYAEGPH